MKPRAASSALETPVAAPQPQASFVIAGSATERMMGAIGPWYSASDSACAVVVASRPSRRAAAAAAPTAPQEPDAWYSAARACCATPARIATS